MDYRFKASVSEYEKKKVIAIPFNVWEVCDTKGTLSVNVRVGKDKFSCDLQPKGNGVYNIPVTEEFADKYKESVFEVLFTITNQEMNMYGNSPYSKEHPIRRIDSMKLVTQPFDGLCGQTCIAMLAGVTLDEACEIMHCREWQANMGKMIETLDYLFIPHADVLHYTKGEDPEKIKLPDCAILLEKMGRYSHYLIYFEGTYYDPTHGIMEDFDLNNLVGYLEVQIQ